MTQPTGSTPTPVPVRRGSRTGRVLVALAAVLVVVLSALAVRDGGTGGLVWVLVPTVVVAAFVADLWATRRRHERNRAFAASIGWAYQESDPDLIGRWQGEPFGQGSARRATEVLRGRFRGRPVTSFTYRWTTGSGKNRTTHTRHVVALDLPAFLPTLQLTPEGFVTAVARALGGQDIRFESEEFNRAWRVQGGDLRFAHGVVHPQMIDRLMRFPLVGSSLRVEGPSVLSWEPGSTDLQRIAERVGALCDLADAVPRHVWQDHGFGPR